MRNTNKLADWMFWRPRARHHIRVLSNVTYMYSYCFAVPHVSSGNLPVAHIASVFLTLVSIKCFFYPLQGATTLQVLRALEVLSSASRRTGRHDPMCNP